MDNEHIIKAIEASKKISKNGGEYWIGRDLQSILGYVEWRSFAEVIERARMACESTEVDPADHFGEFNKMVVIGSGAMRERKDYFLTRYACYLIAMNGDPIKPEIAIAQVYFAMQTRRMEKFASLSEDEKRLELRKRVKDANKDLASAAKDAGVQKFGVFQNAGYKGLYGMGLKDINKHKGIGKKEKLLDRAGRAELAANEFRITQTEEKIIREDIQGQRAANNAHENVGQEVRSTIRKIGGTMPEDLPVEPPLKQIEKEVNKRKKLKGKTDN